MLQKGERGGQNTRSVKMPKMRMYMLAAVAAAGIGLGGMFGASAMPINKSLAGVTVPTELQKVYYYHRHARRYARRAYRRGYYGGGYGYPAYGGYGYGYGGYGGYGRYYGRRYW